MSVVIGVRVPERIKRELEELGVDVAEEVRRFLERRLREEKVKASLRALEEVRQDIGGIPGDHAARIIREIRGD